MDCGFCRREESDVTAECGVCKKKFYACLRCWGAWNGKLTHCNVRIGLKRVPGGWEQPSLDTLLREACEQEAKFTSQLTLKTLDVLVSDPISIYGSASTEDLKEAVLKFSLRDSAEDMRAWTLSRYLTLMASKDLLSGSCGATSEWLEAVTSSNGLSSDMVKINLSALLEKLESCDSPVWYCRITRQPHSFFIECIGDSARVYQSYFGHYTLAQCLDSMVEISKEELVKTLSVAMKDVAAAAVLREAKKRLFLLDVHWGSEEIQYHLNKAPAKSTRIVKNIKSLLQAKRSLWKAALSQRLDELLPDPAPVQFQGAPLGPSELNMQFKEVDILLDDPGVPFVNGELGVGTVVSGDLGRYKLISKTGTQYKFQRL